MASFACGGCGSVHHPFGRGHIEALQAELPAQLPCFRLPTVADAGEVGCATGGAAAAPAASEAPLLGASVPTPLSSAIDAVAACVEASTADASPVRLPHKLAYHELPHWPTEMSIAEIELRRSPAVGPGWTG